jgi:shikimate dehydrogenase
VPTPPRSFQQGLVGVFGDPVAENPTQAMLEPAFAEMGLDWRYLTVHVRPEDLGDAVRGARAMNWRGFNCTIPHKVDVIDHLDRLNPAAATIGAVNCVVIEDGELIGDNTDGKGFLQSLSAVRPVEGLNVIVLGAGGAARAIAVELAMAGAARLTIVNRTIARARELAGVIQERTPALASAIAWEGMYSVPDGTDVVVNATSIGLYPVVSVRVPVHLDALDPRGVVCDVIPNPPRTLFLQEAKASGFTILDGLGMLVNQGVIGVQLWSGRTPRAAVMRSSLEAIFGAGPSPPT